MSDKVIRVAATSIPQRVAGAIAKTMRESRSAEVQAIGAGAVNQMIKAVILACQYVQPDKMQPFCVPSFIEVDVDGRPCTAVHLLVLTAAAQHEAHTTDF